MWGRVRARLMLGLAACQGPMPRPANTIQKAIGLAKADRQLAAQQPFRRDSYQRWTFADFATREMCLLAVKSVYDGDWYDHIDPMPGQTFEEALKNPGQLRLQYLKQWISGCLATTYSQEALRRIKRNGEDLEEGDPLLEAIQNAYDEMSVDVAMAENDANAMAYGNVVNRVFYDDDFSKWVLHRYISPYVRVVENENNPAQPWATILIGNVIETNAQGQAVKVPVAEIWIEPTATEEGAYIRVGAGAPGKPEPLKTSKPPLVHIPNILPSNMTRYFVDAPGVPMARLNVALNEDYLSRMGYTTLMQAHGQLVLTNPGADAKIEIGPARAITLKGPPENLPSAAFIAPAADLQGFVAVIDKQLHEIRTVYGIPSEELDVKTDSSGAAIVQAKAPQAERRTARMKVFRWPETQLLRAVIDMGKTHGVEGFEGAGDPEEYDVSVRFADPQSSVSIQDKILLEQHELQLGLVTLGELLMRRHPGRFDSVDEADAWLKEHAAQAQELREMLNPQPPDNGEGPPSDEKKSEESKEKA